jgi:iron complex outermembrane receptor protein
MALARSRLRAPSDLWIITILSVRNTTLIGMTADPRPGETSQRRSLGGEGGRPELNRLGVAAMNEAYSSGAAPRRRPAYLALASRLVLASLAAGLPLVAHAAAPPTPGDAPEVVVTAQKRSQNLQSVPISVTALSGAAVQAEHIATFDDLSRIAPAVSFDSNASFGTTNISIRGVSSQAGSATVGLYIDDVSITTKNFFYEGAIEPVVSDLDRIEVLRGPQGTLYGDSSEGGTIRYLSKQPNLETYSAQITLDTSNTAHGGENYSGAFAVNLPVIKDAFALRISGGSERDSGWIDHYAQDIGPLDAVVGGGALLEKGVNATSVDTFHIIGKFEPGFGLTVTPSFFYQYEHANDTSAFYIDTPGLGLYDQDKEVPEPGADTLKLGSLNVHEDFGPVQLTSVTGLLERTAERQEDGTFFNSASFVSLLEGPPAVPLPTPLNGAPLQQALNVLSNLPSPVQLDTHYVQFTQELRLASPDAPGDHLHWVVGAYFAQQSIHNTDFQRIPGINTTFASLFGAPLEATAAEPTFNAGVPGTTLFPGDEDENDNRTYKETQYSGFGQIDYDFLPSWHLGVGGRYEVAAEHFISVETGFYQIGNLGYTGFPPGTPTTGPYTQSATATSFTPKVTLSHDIDRNETVYASAGEGFRLGGPTGPIVFGPNTVCASDFALINQTTQPTKFGSDSLWTYELGSKGRYFDNRFSLNGAAFYTDWRNVQQSIYLPDCGYYFTENVGDARIYGGELEAAFRITDNLTINANASAESATITSSINPVTVPVGSNLIDIPQETFDVALNYRWPITAALRLAAQINYDWTGRSNGSYQRFTNTVALGSLTNLNFNNPSYGVMNANIILSMKGYELSLYAKNLLNDQTIIQTPEINTVYEGYTVHPRVLGATLKAFF